MELVKRKVVLGIDPGYDRLGYALLEYAFLQAKSSGAGYLTDIDVLDYGLISSTVKASFPARLEEIARGLEDILRRYDINIAVVESFFMRPKQRNATEVAEARGVILYILQSEGIDIVEYAPSHVKRMVAGKGRASKHEVEEKVMMRLGLDEKPKPDDVADALALALCYIFDIEENYAG